MSGVLQIGLELTRKDVWQRLPGDAGPAGGELPLGQAIVDQGGCAGLLRDQLCGFYRPLQRRGHYQREGFLGQSPARREGLASPPRRQSESRQVGVHNVIGVFDLAVANQVGIHSLQCAIAGGSTVRGRSWCSAADSAGTVVIMDRFDERFLHIDMDAFFVEVERLRDPQLRGVPVIVGGLGRRGVVASASYEARELGVRSAMPMGEARRLCPDGRFVPPDHGRYGELSQQAFVVFRSFTPRVEGLSVDEAFLDISGLRLHYPTPRAVGQALRAEIRSQLGLPASVGIAAVKFISKLASDSAKPDGLLLVDSGEELAFLHPMPVRRLWGVGEATHATLESLGVKTIGDLAAVPLRTLVKRLGPSLAAHLSNLADGKDPRQVEPGGGAKSISVEHTYDSDLESQDEVGRALLRLCGRLAGRLHRAGLAGHTLTLKLRYGDFETVTRSATPREPVAVGPAIWDEARVLLERVFMEGRGVRLIGVGVSGLVDVASPQQLSLDSGARNVAAETAEKVRERFGENAVLPASLIVDRPKNGRGE